MSRENSVLQKVEKTVFEHNMIEHGDKVLMAVSGGADSVCMFHVLNTLKEKIGFSLVCAHLNHCLRDKDADADEAFVRNLCKEYEIPFFSKKVEVSSLAEREKLTLEEAGRCARYEFFDEISEAENVSKIATAHNRNDNAETVLMRIIRGTGIDGLKGISYVRDGKIIRPVLDVSREEIEEYCAENGLRFCTDATNFENDYTRNKIRNELIPYIEKEYNAKFGESLCRLAENATGDSDFLNNYARRYYERIGNPLPGKRPVALHIESLKMLEKSIAARVIRIAANDAQCGIKLEKKHIDDVFELMKKNTGAETALPQSLTVSIQYGWLSFVGDDERKRIAYKNDSFFTEIVPGRPVFVESLNREVRLHIEKASEYECKINETMLDYDLLAGQMLFLRSRREGDRMVWFPDGKTKKIKNILIDNKIPKSDRNRIPLLCTGSEVLAIVGSRVSEKYKVTKDTEEALVVEYGLSE